MDTSGQAAHSTPDGAARHVASPSWHAATLLRAITGFTLAPAILAAIAWDNRLFYGLALTAGAVIGAWEARGMIRASGNEPVDLVLLGLAGFLPFQAVFLVQREDGAPLFGPDGMVVVAIAIMLSLVLPMLRPRLEGALVDWALSLSMAFWIGGLLQFYGPLRDRPDGAFWTISAFGLSWICDTSAYFVGRWTGRTKLAPSISPNKSVEGALGGVAVATLWGAGWAAVWNLFAPPASFQPPLLIAAFGASIAIATIMGDLAESLLKRQTGVKDSGGLVPGHGGLLDRMDSLLFCAPVAVLFVTRFG